MAALLFVLMLEVRIDLAHDPDVRRLFWSLMEDSRYGFAQTEQAAFIVVSENGDVDLVRWPECGRPHEAMWFGAFPRGAVAIVHTHPNWLPHPSKIDMRAARRRNIPVYVLTRTKIMRTTGGQPQLVFDGDWKPNSIR